MGAITEAITGQTWEQVLDARVLQPLELTSCEVGPPSDGTRGFYYEGGSWTPSGHEWWGSPTGNGEQWYHYPDGAVSCSMPDLARWGSLFARHLRRRQMTGGLFSGDQEAYEALLGGFPEATGQIPATYATTNGGYDAGWNTAAANQLVHNGSTGDYFVSLSIVNPPGQRPRVVIVGTNGEFRNSGVGAAMTWLNLQSFGYPQLP